MRRAALILCLAALAACGAEEPRRVVAKLPDDFRFERRSFPDERVSLELPQPMFIEDREPPGVFRASFGDWFVTGFAYRRREPLPRRPAELRAARTRLVRAARERGRGTGFELVDARTTRAAGAPAVELVADQTLSRVRFRTRSLHVYKGGAEYVLEMFAPVDKFRSLDRRVFDRAVRSLRVDRRGPRRSP